METGAGAAGKGKKRNEYVPKCTRMVRYGKENGGGDGAAVYGSAASDSDTNQKQGRGGRMEGARTDLQIFNTGAVELKMDFEIREQNSRSQQLKTERYLIIFDFEAELRKLIQGTSKMYQKLGRSTAMYVCVTIVGCKGLWNYTVNAYGANAPTKVDRNQIVCTPIEIRNIQDDVQVKEGIENCIRMTKYSLGIRI